MRPRREQVLTVLRDAGEPLTVQAVAARLGVHPNTVRFHLETLTAAGQVDLVPTPRTGRGRPARAFRAHSGMDPAGPRHYRDLAAALTTAVLTSPDGRERARAAGRAWGLTLARTEERPVEDPATALGHVVDVLAGLDFAPDPPELDASGAGSVGVRHCPFLEVATAAEEVVCAVHLGLMQGVLERLGAPVTVGALRPFERPDLCRALIRPRGGATDAPG